jgi:hypothetical protein
MGVVIAVLVLVLVAAVVAVVGAPLRRARAQEGRTGDVARPTAGELAGQPLAPTRDDLEAAREAKYREIRDTELDFRTGKLSRDDYETIDADLRAEAIAILDRIEELTPRDA